MGQVDDRDGSIQAGGQDKSRLGRWSRGNDSRTRPTLKMDWSRPTVETSRPRFDGRGGSTRANNKDELGC